MRALTEVSSADDPRLAEYLALYESSARKRHEEGGYFIAEGITVLERLLGSDHEVRSVLLLREKVDRVQPLLERVDAPVYVAERDLLRQVAGFDLHRGVVASATRRRLPSVGDVARTARLIGVLEGLNDQENLGTIARCARALGVDALVLDPTCADLYSRRCVRVSMGEVLSLPWARAAAWPDALLELRDAGVRLLALTPAHDAIDIVDVDVTRPCALLVGAEGPGLSAAAIAAADVRVRIPLQHGVDSLNVGHAFAIAAHHVGRRASDG